MKLLKGFRVQKIGGLAAGGFAASKVSEVASTQLAKVDAVSQYKDVIGSVAPIVAGVILHGQKGEFVKEAGNGMVAVGGANLINSLVGEGGPLVAGVSPMLGNVEEMSSMSSEEDPMIAGYNYGTMESDSQF